MPSQVSFSPAPQPGSAPFPAPSVWSSGSGPPDCGPASLIAEDRTSFKPVCGQRIEQLKQIWNLTWLWSCCFWCCSLCDSLCREEICSSCSSRAWWSSTFSLISVLLLVCSSSPCQDIREEALILSDWPHGPTSNHWFFYPTLFSASCSFLCSSVTSCAWLTLSWLTALSRERRSSESASSESSDWCSAATWPRQRSHDE